MNSKVIKGWAAFPINSTEYSYFSLPHCIRPKCNLPIVFYYQVFSIVSSVDIHK